VLGDAVGAYAVRCSRIQMLLHSWEDFWNAMLLIMT